MFLVSHLLFAVLAALRAFFRSRLDTSLEILALRHQVAVLKRKRRRARPTRIDRLFWMTLRSAWSRWSDTLVIVKPATVIAWHRAGFRLYWRWRSRSRGGRPRISDEIKTPIRRMRSENSGWGAPKIHGELLNLGFQISERTVGRYLRRALSTCDVAGHSELGTQRVLRSLRSRSHPARPRMIAIARGGDC
jgi:putative transposase